MMNQIIWNSWNGLASRRKCGRIEGVIQQKTLGTSLRQEKSLIIPVHARGNACRTLDENVTCIPIHNCSEKFSYPAVPQAYITLIVIKLNEKLFFGRELKILHQNLFLQGNTSVPVRVTFANTIPNQCFWNILPDCNTHIHMKCVHSGDY
jgi:hypothetical protein